MADNKTNKNQRKILATAEEEFLMKGFAGARTAEIAKGAGVTHAMLHYYFNSKEQLFEQVMNEKFLQLREMVAMVSASEELPVVERIVEVMRRRPKARRKGGGARIRENVQIVLNRICPA